MRSRQVMACVRCVVAVSVCAMIAATSWGCAASARENHYKAQARISMPTGGDGSRLRPSGTPAVATVEDPASSR